MGRGGKINAAGDFLKAVSGRRGLAQAVGEEPVELPLTKVLAALALTTGQGGSKSTS
jgi:hypothetical protein